MKILVWDVPTRLFHWLLAASFATAWLTAEIPALFAVHLAAGLAALWLVMFRLLWGFVGTRHARFGSFRYSPGEALRYGKAVLKGAAGRFIGHNPAGSWAIYLLLGMGLAVSLSGLLTLALGETGPFGATPLKDAHEVIAYVMLGLVAVHLIGVAVESRLHRENLAASMVSGLKHGAASDAIPASRGGVGAAVVAGVAALGAVSFMLTSHLSDRRGWEGFATPQEAQLWLKECGSCHTAHAPGLLPAASWSALMAGQQDHFGEDLALDPASTAAITAFLTRHAAPQGGEGGLRVSDTRWWKRAHHHFADTVWSDKRVGSKANCAACHKDADSGRYSRLAIKPPQGLPPDKTHNLFAMN